MAGRSKTKMEQVRSELVPDSERLADVALVEADVENQVSIDSLAASAAVIITTVGPYANYGRPVVKVGLMDLRELSRSGSCNCLCTDTTVVTVLFPSCTTTTELSTGMYRELHALLRPDRRGTVHEEDDRRV